MFHESAKAADSRPVPGGSVKHNAREDTSSGLAVVHDGSPRLGARGQAKAKWVDVWENFRRWALWATEALGEKMEPMLVLFFEPTMLLTSDSYFYLFLPPPSLFPVPASLPPPSSLLSPVLLQLFADHFWPSSLCTNPGDPYRGALKRSSNHK